MTYRLTTRQVIAIQAKECPEAPRLNDSGKLDAALAAPFQTFDGVDLTPTLVEKGAKLLLGVSRAQAFANGNKRTAWIVFVTTIEVNGLRVRDCPASEVEKMMLDVDTHAISEADFILWCNGLVYIPRAP